MTGQDFRGYVVGASILVGIAAVAYVAWKGWGIGKEVVTKDLNPASDQNLAYRATNAAGAAITGNQDFSLGSWLYDVTHPAYDPNAKPVANKSSPWSDVAALWK